MKKIVILLLMAALLLTACQSELVNISIDRENQTLFDGTYEYRYEELENGSMHSITIIYPDGSRYEWMETLTDTYTNGSYDSSLYVDADRLVDAVLGTVIIGEPEPETEEPPVLLILMSLMLLGLGLWEAAYPEQAWYFAHGWKYKYAEPSDLAIALIRAMGIIEILLGAIQIIAAIAGV